MSEKWTAADIPDQSGRRAIVTGANSGLGPGDRPRARSQRRERDAGGARHREGRATPPPRSARPSPPRRCGVAALDLADLDSVRAFADAREDIGLDLLVNNAGVMALAAPHDQGRLRDAVRHQPPRPLRAHRAADAGAREGRRPARGHALQPRPQDREDELRRPPGRARATSAGRPTASPSSPTCCSPSSCSGAPSAAGLALKSMAAHPGYAATNLQTRGSGGEAACSRGSRTA